MRSHFGHGPAAGLLLAPLFLVLASAASATVAFDDHFTGNSGGIPAGWSLFAGPGTAMESGSDVRLDGDVILITAATVDPSDWTVTITTYLSGSNSEAGVGLYDPDTGSRFGFGLRLSDQRLEVTGANVPGGEQQYTAGYVGGYAGGPIRVRLVFDSLSFSVSTFPPDFSAGPIAYGEAFPSFTRADLGAAARVMIVNDDATDLPGWSSLDRVTVEAGPPVPVQETTIGRIKALYCR